MKATTEGSESAGGAKVAARDSLDPTPSFWIILIPKELQCSMEPIEKGEVTRRKGREGKGGWEGFS